MKLLNTVFAFAPVLLLAFSLRADQPPAPPECAIPNGIGVNIHFTDPKPGELDQLYAAGFRWVRMDFGWGGIERKKDEYDFSAYDRLIAALDAHHIRAYFILDYSNRNYDKDLSPHTGEGRAAFAKWAAASVRHFKGHGILWEMYNEPNIFFWRPRPDVDDYAKLAIAVGRAIRESEPGEIYIGPATSTIDLPFLEACFKAGCLEYWSAVSVHPYRQKDPETVAGEYRKLRQLIARYAPKGRQIPIISGEWGYSSAWKDFDEERQAKYLPRELLTNIANEIPVSIWYDWHEDGVDPKEPEHHFGTVHNEYHKELRPAAYDAKPAYLAAQTLSETLKGFRFSKRLAVGGTDDCVLLFENGVEQRLAGWTLAAKPHAIDLQSSDKADEHLEFFDSSVSIIQFSKRFTLLNSARYWKPAKPNELLRIAAAWTRAPLEVAVAGPGVARVETTVRNPLDHEIAIIANGTRHVLKPRETCPLISEEEVSRNESAPPLLSVLEIEGLGKVAQSSDVVVTNPLHAFIFPRTGKTQSVIIENASAAAFETMVFLNGSNGTSFKLLEFKAGETRKVVTFTMPPDCPDDGQAGLLLVGVPNRLELEVPPARYVPIKIERKDTTAAWKLIDDGDPKVGSEHRLSDKAPHIGPPAPGLPCIEVGYCWQDGWKFVRLVPKSEMKVRDLPRSLGIWVFGDSKGNLARMRFTDATGQTFQPDAGPITWTGWRYVEFPLTGHDTAHWGGANDGVVHDSIRIDTLFLVDSAHRKGVNSQVFISAPTLIYDK